MESPRFAVIPASELTCPSWYKPGQSDLPDDADSLLNINAAIPQAIKKRLEVFAKQNGVEIKWLVAEALHEYLQRRESGHIVQLKAHLRDIDGGL